jgi:ectoine hydroxylase-related dioxygenase (phytanoyl-CoA dioxygenase family)
MYEMNLPWVESPFFAQILKAKNLTSADAKIATEYNEKGYVVLQNIFSDQLIENIKKDMLEKGFNPDYPIETARNEVRIQDLWLKSESVQQMAIHPEIIKTLEMLYDREVIPFQTLNFKVGSQQMAHSDTMHFSCLPARYMCGVWVALEDITEENGPLFYYPGSHKTPEYDFSHFKNTLEDNSYENYPEYEKFIEQLMDVSPYKKEKFLAKKGDALIWSSNIVHGGSAVIDPQSTRFSQVTHYYFKDCVYYTPMLSNMATKELFLRRFLVNIRNGETLVNNWNSKPTRFMRTRDQLFTINNHLNLHKYLRWIAAKLSK